MRCKGVKTQNFSLNVIFVFFKCKMEKWVGVFGITAHVVLLNAKLL